MDTRRFRNHPSSEALAQVRWLGWVMIMMFVLVQTATGGTALVERSEQSTSQISPYVQARADFDPQTHQVTVEANPPAAIWDSTADLRRRSFVVYEDNVRQVVNDVELVDSPLSIGVLLENGGRYHAVNEAISDNASRAARELMQAINPNDQVTIWTYGDHVQALADPTKSASGLQQGQLYLPVAPSSESNFYDALVTTLPRVQQMPGRKALIVISTGIDTFSDADYPAVLRAARATAVPICVINLGPAVRSALTVDGSDPQPYSRLNWQQAASQLSHLAQVSGCRALTPGSSFEFPAMYDRLLPNLRLQYVIHYRSTALGLPGTRQVRIDWVEGNASPQEKLKHLVGRTREFAQTQYELPTSAVLAGAETLKWPLLELPASPPIQIPLQATAASQPLSEALLASATSGAEGTQPR
jgi:hypothetical protein